MLKIVIHNHSFRDFYLSMNIHQVLINLTNIFVLKVVLKEWISSLASFDNLMLHLTYEWLLTTASMM